MNRVRLPSILICLVLLAAAPLQVAASGGDDPDDGMEPDANESSETPSDPDDASSSEASDRSDDPAANETEPERAEDEKAQDDEASKTSDEPDVDETDAEPEDADDARDPEAGDDPDDGREDGRDREDEGRDEEADGDTAREDPRFDDRDEDDDRDERREVRLRVEEDEAEVRSRARQPDVREEVELRFRAPEAAFRLEMRNETRTDRTDVDLRVSVPQLLEYEDLDGNGRYDLTDRVLQAVDIRSAAATVTDTSRQDGARFHVAYALPGGGTFAVATFVPDVRTQLGNVTVAAGEAKIDFIVEGFNYTSPTSALALRVDVDSRFEARARSVAEVSSTGGDQRAYFRWADWAIVDGTAKSVHATVYAVEEHAANATARPIVYLSYPRGDLIVHDPTLGVVTVQTLDDVVAAAGRLVLGDAPAYLAAAGLSTLLVAGLGWARMRGARKSG